MYQSHPPFVKVPLQDVRQRRGSPRLGRRREGQRRFLQADAARPDAMGLGGRSDVVVCGLGRRQPPLDGAVETARRLGVAPERCAAIEDSANGIRAAHAAGMRVVAIPNRRYPPPDALALADEVLGSLTELTPGAISSQ